jgi:hypothetical protein
MIKNKSAHLIHNLTGYEPGVKYYYIHSTSEQQSHLRKI